MASRLVSLLDRFNREHPWSHNDFYAPVVIRQARAVRRAGGTRGLDIGCGTGRLVLRLASQLPKVTGVEQDPTAAAVAVAAAAGHPDVQIIVGSFPEAVDTSFDLVCMVAVLHHLPLVDGIRAARDAVADSGRLIIVGAYRETSADRTLSILSLILNPVMGVLKHPGRADHYPAHMPAPTAYPTDTFREIRDVLQRELPSVRTSRGLFWRFVATWNAPPTRVQESSLTSARSTLTYRLICRGLNRARHAPDRRLSGAS